MESRNARLLRRGDIITVDAEHGETEVVRNVSVTVELSNGAVVTFDAADAVEVHGQEDLSEVVGEVEALQAEDPRKQTTTKTKQSRSK
jgi:predicted dehydrogenase